MNCRGWNSHIALYVEGDLELDLVRGLETHLVVCEECRTFAEDLRQSQADIRSLRSEIVDNASLNRVRANVLDQVRTIQERRTWLDRVAIFLWGGFHWRYAVLGSAALVLVTFMAWRLSMRSPAAVPVQSRIAVSVPQPSQPVMLPAVEKASDVPVAKRRVRTPKRMKPVELTAVAVAVDDKPKPPDIVVQLMTDDPNVVIYWLIENTGGM